MKPLSITVGSDPELIIVDAKAQPVSAIRILGKDKTNPIQLGNSIRMYADNALVEAAFDPVPPSGIVARIGDVLRRMKKALGGYSILPQAAIIFPTEELKAVLLNDDGTPKLTAWDVGCNPNFDAYVRAPNQMGPFKDGLRTGSFHIHIGNAAWKEGMDERLMTLDSKVMAIKLLDYYLGVSSILFDKDESSPLRRKLYGKAGEFRPTDYGIEYRVLGNYALRSPRLVKLVFDLVDVAMTDISLGRGQDVLKAVDEKAVIHTINTNDKKAALDMLSGMKLARPILNEIIKEETIPGLSEAWGI